MFARYRNWFICSDMFKKISGLLDALEPKLSLWVLLGGSSISFGIPAWAAHATGWLSVYGPIAWVLSGFLGLTVTAVITQFVLHAYYKIQLISRLSKIEAGLDVVNPLDSNFYQRRIHLTSFIPPSGDAVVGKHFHKCEIIGPINIVPFGCIITKSLYVSSDYIVISNDALNNNKIKNGNIFKDCTFSECKFYFVSFLISEAAYDVFNRTGGCNWITKPPALPDGNRAMQSV